MFWEGTLDQFQFRLSKSVPLRYVGPGQSLRGPNGVRQSVWAARSGAGRTFANGTNRNIELFPPVAITSLVSGPKLTPLNAARSDGFEMSGAVADPCGTYARFPIVPSEHEKNDGPSQEPAVADARSHPADRTRP